MLRIRPPQRQLLGDFLFEQMVPEDHLLRRIAAVVDFSFADELLADCYSQRYGRPAKEPELMVKLIPRVPLRPIGRAAGRRAAGQRSHALVCWPGRPGPRRG